MHDARNGMVKTMNMNMHSRETRRGKRRQTYLTATVVIGAAKHSVWVRDISAGGAQIFFEDPISVGQRIIFTVDKNQRGAIVRWVNHPLAGIEFEQGQAIDLGAAT